MGNRNALWVGALMVLSTFAVLPGGTGADGGAAAPRAPTMIYNVNDLQNMSVGLGNEYALGNDINASATSGWNGGAGFQPVGDSGRAFTGTFDGRGFNITGLTINRGNQDLVGLFGYVQSGKISNVNLENAVVSGRNNVGGIAAYLISATIAGSSFNGAVKGTGSFVGGIAGYSNSGTVSNCFSTGSVTGGGDFCGGISGYNAQASVSSCYSTSTIKGNYETGGIGGYTYFTTVSNCYFAGSVTGYSATGGIIGFTDFSSTITKSYNTGSVGGSYDSGGITGLLYRSTASYCYNTGPVELSAFYAGGVAAEAYYSTVTNCYSTGPVSGNSNIGGLVAFTYFTSLSNSYSTGLVRGSGNTGGLVGTTTNTGWSYCFWDVQSAGISWSALGTGKTTDEMMTQTTYTGWDFSAIWGIFGGTTYPYLLWRYPSAVMLSGTAYSDNGITPMGSGAPVLVVDHFGLSVAHFPARTDFSGRYRQMVDSGAFLAAASKPPVRGTSYGKENSAQSASLDVFNQTVFARAAPGKTISVKQIEAVKAAFRTDQPLPLTFSDKGLDLPAGVPLVTGAGTVFETDRNLTAAGAALDFNGKLSPMKDVLLKAGDMRFNAGFITAKNLTLNCTGDIIFREATALGTLTVLIARDIHVQNTLQAASFTQSAGTGTTEFSGVLDAGAGGVSVTTARVQGRVLAGTLSLGTDTALLNGLVGGDPGQAGADRITLLKNIRIGTHFFDGIDLYKFKPAGDTTVATEDEAYSVDYQPMNAGDVLTWSVETDAGWLSMDKATGVLSGTPGNADVGVYQVTVTAHDGPKSLSRSFTLEVLNVNDPPEILTADLLQAVQDQPYGVVYEALDIDPTHDALTWSLETDAAWLALDGSRIHGVPGNSDVGSYSVNVSVSDGNGGTDSHNFTLTVENVNDRPLITVEPAATALEDSQYRVAFNATDIDDEGGLNWTLKTSAGWLRMDRATGVLSGTPSNNDIGSYWVEVTVTDDEGASDTRGFMLTVLNVNDAPVWVSVPADQTLMEGEALLLDISASDIDKGDVIRYSLSTAPASGITVNPASGAMRWTRAIPGTYQVTLTATDGIANITHQFNVTVNKLPVPPANNPPRIDTVTVTPVKAGQRFTYKLNGSDTDSWDAKNLTFRLVSGPAGMIVSADGSVLWTPAKDQVGSHTVTIALSDGKDTATSVFTVEVRKPAAVAAQTAGYNEGWLLAMVFLGLFVGVLLMFLMTRKRTIAPGPAQSPPPSFPMAPLPPVEKPAPPPVMPPAAPPAQPPAAPPAEPLPTLPPPESTVEKKPPPEFKP